jgi:hypothetical protein
MAMIRTAPIPTKTRGQLEMEDLLGVPIEEALHRAYVIERRSLREIAVLWNRDFSTISKWLRDFNISRLDRNHT